MKLNHDCVRDVMLYIEENQTYNEIISAGSIVLPNYQPVDIAYTLEKLIEAGFLNGDITRYFGNLPDIDITSITFDGHEFLDNIRPNDIWVETKESAIKIGSASLQVLATIASQLATTYLAKKFGLQ